MKKIRFFIVLIYLISFLPNTTLSQAFESSSVPKDTLVSRKLYIHTDRDQYFLGDTIWYKAYYLDGQSNKFVPGLISMYVDVINEAGQSVLDLVVPIDNGAADGAIDLPGFMEPGNYMLRAFTDIQKQIGEDAFFYKQVIISKLESFVEGADPPDPVLAQDINVAFLPEGGMLLEGHVNTLGIKAIDSNGQGITVQGEIHNSRGEAVAAFTTSYKGMALAQLSPKKGETYSASVQGYPEYSYIFDDVVAAGIKLEFEKATTNDLHFRVVTNAESLLRRTYYFALSHHGEVLFHKKFVPKDKSFPITVNKDALPAGINRLVLLDEQLLPVSERLIFSTNFQINDIRIKPDKQAYETRSRVRLRLSDAREMDNQSWSNLSLVVVDEFATSQDDPSTNILSWLLIDSELKGHIESPQEYFVDDPQMASATKLDLLMITQGWSRYIWSKPEEYLALKTADEEGFNISGTVNRVVGNIPVTEGTVELKVYNSDFMHMDELEINEEGRFIFEDVNFMDTAYVFIQARNKRDKLTFKVSLDPLFNKFPESSAKYLPKLESTSVKQAELYQKQYDNLQALKEYTLSSGAFYIEEVTVYDYKREKDDGHFRIYPKPTNSKEITNRDLTYPSVIDYIQGRFAGVTVTSTKNIIIRGKSSLTGGALRAEIFSMRGAEDPGHEEEYTSALLLLDGLPVSKDAFLSIPMSDIDKVEVLKNPGETAIFGNRGAGGVVSVFTKRGGAPEYIDKYLPGTIAEKLAGYASNREFYSPKYTPETINAERPDHRIVLHWDPNIFTEKGRASVSFYASDDLSRYNVYVEGITRDGKICLGRAKFEVDKRQETQ